MPHGLTVEQQEALFVRVRIEEITRKITSNELDIDYAAERFVQIAFLRTSNFNVYVVIT